MKSLVAKILLVSAICLFTYNARAFLPMIGSYAQRLEWLDKWPSTGYYAFNCSGLIAYAHGDDWTSEREMYAGDHGKFMLIHDYSSLISLLNSMDLEPGDIVVFGGPDNAGLHVIAYLGNRRWIDSDSRRGDVQSYRMSQKQVDDPWFSGRAHVFRWKKPAKIRFNPGFFRQEQKGMEAN